MSRGPGSAGPRRPSIPISLLPLGPVVAVSVACLVVALWGDDLQGLVAERSPMQFPWLALELLPSAVAATALRSDLWFVERRGRGRGVPARLARAGLATAVGLAHAAWCAAGAPDGASLVAADPGIAALVALTTASAGGAAALVGVPLGIVTMASVTAVLTLSVVGLPEALLEPAPERALLLVAVASLLALTALAVRRPVGDLR